MTVMCTRKTRTLDGHGRAVDGQPIRPGDVFKTLAGRMTTPYPKSRTEKCASYWLIQSAALEAMERGDEFNSRIFKSITVLKGGWLTPADRDAMLMYLFEHQPPTVKSVLKAMGTTD
jgi:hypothetical protein